MANSTIDIAFKITGNCASELKRALHGFSKAAFLFADTANKIFGKNSRFVARLKNR